ncbi:MAG: DNA primase [Ardenticatenaceae bacterium]|nr:DNA primase [Anaerolineales bacterium]MCB8941323.1 DNA primase [Ardenticatenaceae bacterium]MCB8972678.1 DNA primase [Ardenticatenaceae bacterium]
MTVTEEIKSRLDIVDIVSESVSLRRSGRNYAGFCPFHQNTRTPAFFVFPETQTWRCFGACAEGGDLFSYVMKKEGWEFKEALKNMAQRAGVTLEEEKPVNKEVQKAQNKQAGLLQAASDYFNQLFLYAPQAEEARQYVARRSLNEDTIAHFAIGFALDSWDACRSHFNMQGYSDQELLAAGLLTENPDKGTKYDRFRNRLMIPIRDVDGRIVGFGARTLEKDGIPKYLNSPQTDLFDKSHLLYGLDSAKRAIREARQAVIVEGYMDVMQAWQAGFQNVVAQMGTALTEHQLRMLKRYTKQFILALDADAAGAKATLRSLQVARETLDRDVEVKFDAHGLVHHEGRLQADIRVITMPEGKDPDNIIQENPEDWPKLVAQAKPVVAYVISVATADLDMNDAKAKTAVAQQVLPLIKDIQDPIERDHYWQLLARTLRIDERALRQIRLPQPPQRTVRREETAVPTKKPGGQPAKTSWAAVPKKGVSSGSPIASDMRQADFLQHAIRSPQIIVRVNQKLQECGQGQVVDGDFLMAEDRAIMRQMYQLIADSPVVTIDELWDSLEQTLQNRLKFLLTLPQSPETELERISDTLVLSVLDWRLAKVRLLLSEVKHLLREAQTEGDVEALAIYTQQLKELPLAVLQLNKARDSMSATSRRRAEDAMNGRY